MKVLPMDSASRKTFVANLSLQNGYETKPLQSNLSWRGGHGIKRLFNLCTSEFGAPLYKKKEHETYVKKSFGFKKLPLHFLKKT